MTRNVANGKTFQSCIKIAGIPILSPLVSEERRKELNDDRSKAIEIEKRLSRKRSSIDSGVMTGSYTETLKTNDFTQLENSIFPQLSITDLTSDKSDPQNNECLVRVDGTSNDSFLKAALEDTEFREFFYSTAERIFKDNKLEHTNNNLPHNSPLFEHKNVLVLSELSKVSDETITSNNSNYNDELDRSVCNSAISTIEVVESTNLIEAVNHDTNRSEVVDEETFPPQPMVRRNSYTLESPSPVLLEHIAKTNGGIKQDIKKWISLSDKKEKGKELGFKSFSSVKKIKKTWNKNHSSHSKLDHIHVSKMKGSLKGLSPLPSRSKTFVRCNKKYNSFNHSLPTSKRTSPNTFYGSDHSIYHVQSDLDRSGNMIETFDDSSICDKENVHNNVDLVSLAPNFTDTLSSNKNSCTSESNYDGMEFLLNPHIDLSESLSKFSVSTKCTAFQQKLVNDKIFKDKPYKKDHSDEVNDSVSVCSSLSLSKFLPNDLSGHSTDEDLSSLFSELQLQHERQITELLEKQQREKIKLAELHSNNATVSSRSTTSLSISSIPQDTNPSQTSIGGERRTPCSRELFPTQITSPNQGQAITQQRISGKGELAALKLTACVRGYLTRRLLKTERVQQLIDVIKESLNCAFSLQSQSQLRKNDLELHERLAQQLTAALYELQAIISAPVAKRMAIIATDREKLRKPLSRPSSAISSATRKSILRRQQSVDSAEKKPQERRVKTKSLCLSGQSGLSRSAVNIGPSATNTTCDRKTWR